MGKLFKGDVPTDGTTENAAGNSTGLEVVNNNALDITIDNALNAYMCRVTWTTSSPAGNFALYKVMLTYTVTTPLP